ncbi:hypothetical protein LOTGIDRAFT_153532 [Lottia gigantea]|uniref:Uncharacterized protein n=1 Tax=Lottia gigantea TaxID=225164 RepID=V4BY62_LOTGI|nr:hypothetical protein LOTGIDRAFT_153532 [Lottia gigantea]ESO94049.1 hypothetical protein LOTGIDRAFT_153532 [Lottia gigantea]
MWKQEILSDVETRERDDVETREIDDVEAREIDDVETREIDDVETREIDDVEAREIDDIGSEPCRPESRGPQFIHNLVDMFLVYPYFYPTCACSVFFATVSILRYGIRKAYVLVLFATVSIFGFDGFIEPYKTPDITISDIL